MSPPTARPLLALIQPPEIVTPHLAPHGFGAPVLTFPPLGAGLHGPQCGAVPECSTIRALLSWPSISRSEYDPNTSVHAVRLPHRDLASARVSTTVDPPQPALTAPPVSPPAGTAIARRVSTTCPTRTNRPSLGFFDPSTHALVSSDLHRLSIAGCATPSGFLNLLTLCSAHPLSALFHAVAPLGFLLQRFSPLGSLRHLSTPPALLAVSPFGAAPAHIRTAACAALLTLSPGTCDQELRPTASTSRIDASDRSVSSALVLPARRRPFLSWLSSPPGFLSPQTSAPLLNPAFHRVRRQRCKHRARDSRFQRRLSTSPPLMGFDSTLCSTTTSRPK